MKSLWIETFNKNQEFAELSESISCDVCVIGAGIFGITCAYYLKKLGLNTVVLEKDEVASKTTGHTTAKITSQHGLFYNYLVNSYGTKYAKAYLEANEQAIKNIKEIIDEEKIPCDFSYQDNFIYTCSQEEIQNIEEEIEALKTIDFSCQFTSKANLPFEILGGCCFKNQAQFNPVKYMYGLCDAISDSVKIFTKTTVNDINQENESYICSTNKGKVRCKYLILACHYPFLKIPGFYFTKMYQSTSYLIAVDPKKSLFKGMFLSAENPQMSFRTAKVNGQELLLIGGAGHKTGTSCNYESTYGILEKVAKTYYPNCEVLYRWNAQDCISLDKIPYIGLYSNNMPNVFIGTGFKKWGMTLSNVAANIVTDMIEGKENQYDFVFSATRMKPIKNKDELKNMVVQSTKSILVDKVKKSELTFDNLKLNSGGIIEINGQKVGIFKDSRGNIFAVKPVCTHLGCLLTWNDVDKTWDCPCHGSRFDFRGKNLYGPAIKNLEVFDVK